MHRNADAQTHRHSNTDMNEPLDLTSEGTDAQMHGHTPGKLKYRVGTGPSKNGEYKDNAIFNGIKFCSYKKMSPEPLVLY